MKAICFMMSGLMSFVLALPSPARPPNYDEAKVAPYTLPDPLLFADGKRVATPDQWPRRRAEIVALFEDQMPVEENLENCQ